MTRVARILMFPALLATCAAAGQTADAGAKASLIHAYGALHTIYYAEQTYKLDHPQDGFSKDLNTLADMGWVDAAFACGAASCEVKGYKFRYQRLGQDKFRLTAIPLAQRDDPDFGKYPPAMEIDEGGDLRPADMEWPPKEPSQDAAIEKLRTYNTAEMNYAMQYPDIGFSADLESLGSGPDPLAESNAQQAGLVIAPMACPGSVCEDNGYRVTYIRLNKNHYTIVARPLKFGEGGLLSFYTDETAVIRSTVEDRAPTADDPPVTSLDGTPIK